MNTNRYKRTRDVHSKESAEDYVELIDLLIDERGEARVVDIAAKLAVSNVAVSKAVQRLQRDGYVSSQPYRAIFLTDQGKELAAKAKAKHEIVHGFLVSMGVSPAAADSDAEGIYHHVSDETLTAMKKLMDSKKK